MTRTMYDAVDPFKIPANAIMVAGYVDGLYAWSSAGWARFASAVKVTIAVKATTVADVLDIETGNDMNPADWVSWAQLARAHGKTPCAYMNTSTWPSVRKAFTSRGVTEPLYWVAQYDGVASIPAGALAKQYYNNDKLGYDLSVVENSWPGVDAPAFVSTAEDDEMQQIESLAVHPGEYAFPVVSKGHVRFAADGYGAKAKLRVVVWQGNSPVVHDGVVVGGGFTDIALTPQTSAVTVKREDSGDFPVAVGLY